jgi:hypothetical protein
MLGYSSRGGVGGFGVNLLNSWLVPSLKNQRIIICKLIINY